MDKSTAKKIVESALNDKFNDENFYPFISNFFKTANLFDKPESIEVNEQFKSVISQCYKIGKYVDDEKNQIDVLKVELVSDHSIDKARTTQRNFISNCLKKTSADAAAVAFINFQSNDWRFSLVKHEHSIAVENEKIINKDEITPAKRWSFLVGKNEGCHTAISRFVPILESNIKPNLNEIQNAFNIEQVTDEFYKKYKDLFLRIKEELDTLISEDEILKSDFDYKGIKTEDFAKKTIGQLAFIYFLQKKGWLGVKAKDEWGSGPKNFLRNIFDNRKSFGQNFFNDILEPLFYKGLAQDRGKESIYPELNNCRIPFLNGGLFEPMNGYSWETTNIVFHDELFSNKNITAEEDVGDGILDIFDRYNFTVYESEPLEKEVAVDPEMLGKVFENLLNVKDRKDKGAFYTPREIVHFICQESLVSYLYNENKSNLNLEKLRLFIFSGVSDGLSESAQELDGLLKDVKICDPAVGSGAFPLGMLNEIVKARQNLNGFLKNTRSKYELKFDAISNSLYGVDLDPGAIEIAKLRMWLSLAVDEGNPTPLPNLDNKLIQGNSLISKYRGIEVFGEEFFNEIQFKLDHQNNIKEIINELQSKYVELHNKNMLDESKKAELDKKLILYKKRLLDINKVKSSESLQLFDRGTENSEARNKINLLKEKVKSYLVETSKTKKEDLKSQIDNLKWDLIELSLIDSKNLEHLKEIRYLRERNEKPFFIWELEFNEVFNEKKGFDIVIGNPPYVQIQKFSGSQTQKNLENEGYETFTKYGDLYCLFYERGISILKQGGILIFITSNKWMRSGYGEKLRSLFLKQNPLFLADLGPNIFESATVDTNIILIEKSTFKDQLEGLTVTDSWKKIGDLSKYISENKNPIKKLNSNSWAIGSDFDQNIIEKIQSYGKPLIKWDVKFSFGVKTGLNEAFVIDETTKNCLIALDASANEIIKPLIRGKDVRRYICISSNLYVILTKFGSYKYLKNRYPSIYEHLLKYEVKLKDRGQCQSTRTGKSFSEDYDGQHHWLELDNNPTDSFIDMFNNEKIVWGNISYHSCFSLLDSGIYLLAPSILMTSNKVNLKYILGCLNSTLFNWEFKRSGIFLGKAYEWKKVYVEQIHIPVITKDNQYICDEIVELVDEIRQSKKMNSLSNTTSLELKINHLIYTLYKLSDDEISYIELSNSL